ncbi:molybdopterin-synthase adenylyltransferase MoeB [Cellulomonas sp.]|uniref:molybdopterin-synthase adenylyltransferase MoeB n=1 Tax=Cellulomonas sp. TaxID=40001 RepID=UPI001B246CCF|nr:molybdopterin-synthase adenylyltransferase MoeB [Cellulomonas sp.]MBO9555750.1 molybdopterin-synthase adenylyltransferase MoeB [Cellulomonas sp.]
MPLPPLVEPGPPLTLDQLARASRHLLLPGLGSDGQRRLRAARVCVVGAGGLGAPVLQYLAAAGVGTLGIVDDDVVDVSNLQRQVIHGTDDVGRPKVESARDAIAALDPSIVVEVHPTRLADENVDDVLGGYDLVVDGTDNFPTRYLVNDACVRLGLPEVWGSVLRFDAQTTVFWGRPPAGVPAVQLRDLFPTPPPADQVPSCAEAGVLGALCGQVGSVMAVEAVKLVTGLGEPLLGRVLVLDALRGRWQEVPLRSAPARSAAPGPGAGQHVAGPRDVSPSAPSAHASSGVWSSGAGSSAPAPHRTDVSRGPGVPQVTVDELAALLADGDVYLIDVREPAEAAAASIPGARLVPLGTVLDGSALPDLPRDREILVHCAVGARSLVAAQVLRDAGFDATNVEGGIAAWLDAR